MDEHYHGDLLDFLGGFPRRRTGEKSEELDTPRRWFEQEAEQSDLDGGAAEPIIALALGGSLPLGRLLSLVRGLLTSLPAAAGNTPAPVPTESPLPGHRSAPVLPVVPEITGATAPGGERWSCPGGSWLCRQASGCWEPRGCWCGNCGPARPWGV